MLSNEVVGLATQVYKQLEATGRALASVDNVRHVRSENKGSPVPDYKKDRKERTYNFSFWEELAQKLEEKVCGILKRSW